MDKLHILDLNGKKNSVSIAVLTEIDLLRIDAKVSLHYEYLKDNINAATKSLFSNIRSDYTFLIWDRILSCNIQI